MSVSVLSAARRLGTKSGWNLTHLHMQKMLYLTHMFHLAEVNEPLVFGSFEAWEFGPVHPKLYQVLKKCRSDVVDASVLRRYSDIDDDTTHAEYIDAAEEQLPRKRLVAITHWSEGAWRKNYRSGVRGIEIPNDDIVEEYRRRKNGAA